MSTTAKTKSKPKTKTANKTANGGGKIKVLAKENPKRKGTKAHAQFAKYKTGMTVEEARSAGIGTMKYDVEHKFISIA